MGNFNEYSIVCDSDSLSIKLCKIIDFLSAVKLAADFMMSQIALS